MGPRPCHPSMSGSGQYKAGGTVLAHILSGLFVAVFPHAARFAPNSAQRAYLEATVLFVRCRGSAQLVVQPVWGVSLLDPLTSGLSSHCPYARAATGRMLQQPLSICIASAGLIGGDSLFVRGNVSAQPMVRPVGGVSLCDPQTPDLSSHCSSAGGMEYGSYG